MAKKPAAKTPVAKKPVAKKPAAKKPAPKKPAAAPSRSTWFDDANKPLISEYAQRLQPYMEAMADGHIDARELKAQESRLIAAMREVEPLLSVRLHEKVTRLLCEMAAYDLMQALSAVQESRSQSAFHG